ncbi:excalibur calcium-binding domain-containing protein [Actinosynnema sp. NPDC053489]|uniref:excalibur calcium-binding domain-containing protein n=1 Tax=Actinosynnema sp. NPDC053489 TaxID=3363916 RepID=UPI0037CAB460
MSSGRSVAFAAVALSLATGAVVALSLTANGPRPVEVRQVQVSPIGPGVLSATYTTTLEIARPTAAPVVVAPIEERPVPPITTTTTTSTAITVPTTTQPPTPSSPPTTTTSHRPPWHDNCDPSYRTHGPCVPWRFPRGVKRFCQWLHEQGTTRIEVVGPDHHKLDRDRDGIACERSD